MVVFKTVKRTASIAFDGGRSGVAAVLPALAAVGGYYLTWMVIGFTALLFFAGGQDAPESFGLSRDTPVFVFLLPTTLLHLIGYIPFVQIYRLRVLLLPIGTLLLLFGVLAAGLMSKYPNSAERLSFQHGLLFGFQSLGLLAHMVYLRVRAEKSDAGNPD